MVVRRSTGLFAKIALAITTAILTLVGLETTARLAGFHPAPPATVPIFAWEKKGELWTMLPHRRSITALDADGRRYPLRANTLGLRGPDIGLRREGTTRILFLGDSVTFGYAVDERKTFVHRLDGSTLGGSDSIDAVNAGIPGWSARQQRLFLESYGLALDADVVIVGVVLNDLTELLRGDRLSATGFAITVMNALTWLAERSAAMAAVKRIYVVAVDPAAREVRAVEELAERPESKAVRHAMALHLAELAAIRDLATAQGASFGLVLFPFRFQLDSPDLDAPQRAMRAFGEDQAVPVLDLLPALSAQPADRMMLDRSHLAAEGHAVAAAAIDVWLAESGLARTSPPDQSGPSR